jgi:ABC-type amino acid transport system permease subunit
MESHKKVLGILFVVLGSLQLLTMLLLNMFFGAIFTFALSEAEPQEQRILQLVMSIVRFIPLLVIIFMALPGIAAGIGLLAKQKWAMIVALIIGCLNLFSFPFGTALGIYTIWVYSEDQRQSKVIPA